MNRSPFLAVDDPANREGLACALTMPEAMRSLFWLWKDNLRSLHWNRAFEHWFACLGRYSNASDFDCLQRFIDDYREVFLDTINSSEEGSSDDDF
mmetsp:Transcript_26032/g.30423  ORF Transcript_26032/g.30423 Transcript_26032/m.30423 type:complete len:95 (-) Transcript_26032:45-329(-)